MGERESGEPGRAAPESEKREVHAVLPGPKGPGLGVQEPPQ